MLKDYSESHLYAFCVSKHWLSAQHYSCHCCSPGDSEYEVPKLVVTDIQEQKYKQSVHLSFKLCHLSLNFAINYKLL